MLPAMSAQVIIELFIDTEQSKIGYTFRVQEGDSNGMNQLAEGLMQAIQNKLPEYTEPEEPQDEK